MKRSVCARHVEIIFSWHTVRECFLNENELVPPHPVCRRSRGRQRHVDAVTHPGNVRAEVTVSAGKREKAIAVGQDTDGELPLVSPSLLS